MTNNLNLLLFGSGPQPTRLKLRYPGIWLIPKLHSSGPKVSDAQTLRAIGFLGQASATHGLTSCVFSFDRIRSNSYF